MNTPKRSDNKEKASSPASSVSLPTPPDSAEERSTSPPQSLSSSGRQAFNIFKSIKLGRGLESPWLKLRLEPGDYPLLKEKLKVEELWGYVEDKIRFDYDSQTRILIFRMPTGVHEIFTHEVVKEIERQLQGLCEDVSKPDVAVFANSIGCSASTDVKLLGHYSNHSPDSSFFHINANFPALIIETSFSQKRKDLARLADDYILGSHGNIKLVLGLDIEYQNSKKATVSTWEPKEKVEEDGSLYGYAEKIIDNKLFRNENSSLVVSDTTLDIPLSIFAPPNNAPLLSVISIPYTTLYSFLEYAESRYRTLKRKDGFEVQPPPGKRWKERQKTPEEQLKDSDEACFKASEEKAEKKAYEADSA